MRDVDNDRVEKSEVVRRAGQVNPVAQASTLSTAASNNSKPVPPIPIIHEPEPQSGSNTHRSTPEHNTAL